MLQNVSTEEIITKRTESLQSHKSLISQEENWDYKQHFKDARRKRLTTVFFTFSNSPVFPGEHKDIINQKKAFVDPPAINLIIFERSDTFAVDINNSLIEVSKVNQ